ncbi:MAG: hypothetical protein HQL52_12070 [Magnetococcales bacterium]|nr:hypothetical protein [Magnetococcales bacterium]
MGTLNSRPVLFFATLLLVATLSACGYRFPGEAPVSGISGVQVGGAGSDSAPLLARQLKRKLERRLRLSATQPGDTEGAILHLNLEMPDQSVIVQEQSGRADQYRVTLRAQPRLASEKKSGKNHFPVVSGTATFYDLSAGTTSRAAQIQAQSEALDQLADAVVAVVSENN